MKKIIDCPTSVLQYYCNPFEKNMWPCSSSGNAEKAWAKADYFKISSFLANKQDDSRLDGQIWRELPYETSMDYHNSRIAYMIQNPDKKPLEIDVSDMAGIIIEDGNHRLASNIYTCQKTIPVEIDESQYETFKKLLYTHDEIHQTAFAIEVSKRQEGKICVLEMDNNQKRIFFINKKNEIVTPFGSQTPDEKQNDWKNINEPREFMNSLNNINQIKSYSPEEFIKQIPQDESFDNLLGETSLYLSYLGIQNTQSNRKPGILAKMLSSFK